MVVLGLLLIQHCSLVEQHREGFGTSLGCSVTVVTRHGLPLPRQMAVLGTALRRCGSAASAPSASFVGSSLNLSVRGSTVRPSDN